MLVMSCSNSRFRFTTCQTISEKKKKNSKINDVIGSKKVSYMVVIWLKKRRKTILQ